MWPPQKGYNMYRQHEMLEDGQGKDDTGSRSKGRQSCVN
jgi:hypothetical protein